LYHRAWEVLLVEAITKEGVLESLKRIREEPKRNFVQSYDLVFNFTAVDFKKPDKRINAEVQLPHGRGKELKTVLFAKKALASDAKGLVDKIVTEEELADLNKALAKKLASDYDVFISEPTLMAVIGKNLGTVLGPRKKIPKPVPANAKAIPALVEKLKKTVIASNKARGDYALHSVIGTQALSDEQVAENVMAVYNAIVAQLEQGVMNLKSVYLKTSMGSPVRLGEKKLAVEAQ